MEESNPIYARNTIEFVTVALEFCSFVEKAGEKGVFDFVDKATKLLPLLYLKAALLPQIEEEEESDTEQFVTEEMYEQGITYCVDSWMETDENGDAPVTQLLVGDYLIIEGDMVYRVGHDEFVETHKLK